MYFFYNIIVSLIFKLLIPISWFNTKIKLFLNGRKNTFKQLKKIKKTDTFIWFHCASLGEFEQGRPIIEKFKSKNTNYKILVTFFSPSGFEIRKNYKHADIICYLPIDTKKNAKKFLNIVQPEIVIFVKYEFWPNILNELHQRAIKTILVSAIFRKDQVFFKKSVFAKKFMQNSLKTFDHFFVQDQNSKKLLATIGHSNVTVSGDTRFDSVYKIANQNNNLDFIAKFINSKTKFILVAGSTWAKDEKLLVQYINNHANENQQFIIAPHNINTNEIEKLKNSINKKTILYSKFDTFKNEQVLIINTIGLLKKIYSYATVAYIGGGFGTGIHNILEPATFGIPIIIGPKFNKFKEARDLIAKRSCLVIKNKQELTFYFEKFKEIEQAKTVGYINKKYIKENIGATLSIISYINKILPKFTV